MSCPSYYKNLSSLTHIFAPSFGLDQLVAHCTATKRIFLKFISDLFKPLINSRCFHIILWMSFQLLSWIHTVLHIWFLYHSAASPLEMNEFSPFQPHGFTFWSWICPLIFRPLHWLFLKPSPKMPPHYNSLTPTHFKIQCRNYFFQKAFLGQNRSPSQKPSYHLRLPQSLHLSHYFAAIHLSLTWFLVYNSFLLAEGVTKSLLQFYGGISQTSLLWLTELKCLK